VLVRQTTSEEARFSQPREAACDRCGSTRDLRLLVFHGRVRYAERTICDECAETLFELFIDTPEGS
jgi:superfamily II helicase